VLYNNILNKFRFCFLLAFLQAVNGHAQFDLDTIIYVKPSNLFKNLVEKSWNVYPFNAGEIRFYGLNEQQQPFKHNGEFFTIPSAGLFYHVYNTGRVYQYEPSTVPESLLKFRRIDRTVNIYYNIGSYLFIHQQQLYEFGGYGFWKNNGLLRRYNFKDREWDVIEIDKEIFPALSVVGGALIWMDPTTKNLYTPFQEIRNDGLSEQQEQNRVDLSSYRLNLLTFKWEYLGNLTEDVYQIMKFPSHIFQSDKGLLLAYLNKLFWVDYASNNIKILIDPSIGQTLLRVQPYMLKIWRDEYVYWMNPENQRYDSIHVDLSRFKDSGKVIWKKPIGLKELVWYGLPLLALVALILVAIKRKRKGMISLQEVGADEQHPFTATELSLLSLLFAKQAKGTTATIQEINYVLGLKDKNHGMQKKVRSEVINKINEKFTFINKEKGLLVQNVRSESDKRFFEYLLNPDHVTELRKLIAS
jgi:hypothetical protein